MSIGTVFTAIGAIAIFSFLYIGMGVMVDKIQVHNNEQIASDPAYSDAKHDMMVNYFNIWYVLPAVLGLFLVVIWAFLNAAREKTGEI